MAKEVQTIGVLTSGGDAPGMNAASVQSCDRRLPEVKRSRGIKRGYCRTFAGRDHRYGCA